MLSQIGFNQSLRLLRNMPLFFDKKTINSKTPDYSLKNVHELK